MTEATSPYLNLPIRPMESIRRERIAEGRDPDTGKELPWEEWDATPSMYDESEPQEERFGPMMPGKMK